MIKKLILLILLTALSVEGAGVVFAASSSVASSDLTAEGVINCTNVYREQNGLSDLVENDSLGQAASLKADDIQKYKYWSHENPVTLAEPWNFFDEVQYDYRTAGENLAFNYRSSQGVCDAFMKSSTHRANMLDEKFQEIGVTVRNVDLKIGRGNLVVQMFGSRDDFAEDRAFVLGESTNSRENLSSILATLVAGFLVNFVWLL